MSGSGDLEAFIVSMIERLVELRDVTHPDHFNDIKQDVNLSLDFIHDLVFNFKNKESH